MFWLLLQTIACKNQKFLCGLVPCAELEILQHTIARNWVQAQPVGLRSPPPRQLEAGHCSPTAQRWVVRTMTRNFIFPQSITLSRPHSHSVTFPLIYHETFEHRWGIEGGTPPSAGNPKTRRFLVYLCLLSLHKKVGAVWSAQLHKGKVLLKL